MCIEGLKKVIPKLNRENDFDNKTVAEFYIAKSYWQQKKYKDALPYLLKVDKTFLEKNYIRPDIRENYELLIKYYKQKEDTKLQLLYINRLLEVDELLNHNYKNLSQKILFMYTMLLKLSFPLLLHWFSASSRCRSRDTWQTSTGVGRCCSPVVPPQWFSESRCS